MLAKIAIKIVCVCVCVSVCCGGERACTTVDKSKRPGKLKRGGIKSTAKSAQHRFSLRCVIVFV